MQTMKAARPKTRLSVVASTDIGTHRSRFNQRITETSRAIGIVGGVLVVGLSFESLWDGYTIVYLHVITLSLLL